MSEKSSQHELSPADIPKLADKAQIAPDRASNASIDRQNPLASWVPLVAFLSMVVLAALIIGAIADKQFRGMDELTGRLSWSISLLFFALAIAGTFAAGLREIRENSRIFTSADLARSTAIVLVAGISSFFLLPGRGKFEFNDILLNAVYSEFTLAESFVTAVQVLGGLGLLVLAVAVSTLLYCARRDEAETADADVINVAVRLAEKQRTLRRLLYIGATALVAGTLQAAALYGWGGSFLVPTEALSAEAIKSLPKSMGVLNGLFYSIFLAVIFVPALFTLRRIADNLANRAAPNGSLPEKEQWMKDHSIAASIPQQLIAALAVLAPTIVSTPLTTLIGALTSP